MSDFIQGIVLKIFGNNPILATIFISMIPIIELRGAIPFGSSKEIWGNNALSIFEASVYSVIGSIISAILILLLLIPIFNFLRKTKFFSRLIESFEAKFKKESDKIEHDSNDKKYKNLKKCLGIMTFVAIPFPLTGVWTGSAIAVFLNMGFFKSFSSISVGVLIAASIMMLVSKVLGDNALIIFYIFGILFFILISFYIIRAFSKKKTNSVAN